MYQETSLSILTLNIWALPGNLASDKSKRIEAIGDALCRLRYDVVSLQEVWTKYDYNIIRKKISACYPYHHFFYSGLLGSGLCIFSKWPIEECFYYRFQLNGYFHMIHHGDWCGGKGVGIAQINVNGILVNVYNSHSHAQYSLTEAADDYLVHRLVQAFDTAMFVKLTSLTADVSILAGDLNAEPNSLCLKIIRCVANLEDAYTVAENREDKPETNDCLRNSYRDKSLDMSFPGRRIDYILFKSKETSKVNVESCEFPLEARVPNRDFSYSDHEAVGTKLNIQTFPTSQVMNFDKNAFCQKECLEAALKICDNEILKLTKSIRKYVGILFLVMLLFPVLFFSFDYKGLICTVVTLTSCFCIVMIICQHQNYSWIKNARKRMKLMSNKLKKNI